MKITCHACDAKYTIADEKVTGRTVKIKCKKCGATIVVAADQAAGGGATGAPPQAEHQAHGGGEDDMMATRVAGQDGAPPGITAPEWTVSIAEGQEQQMSQLQLAEAMQRGTVTGDTYVWRDGMADWLSVSQVPELAALLARAAAPPAMTAPGGYAAVSAAPAPAPVEDEPQFGLAGTMVMTESPLMSPLAAGPSAPRPAAGAPAVETPVPAAASSSPGLAGVNQPTAARRANRAERPSVDVFQAAAEGQQREPEKQRPKPPTPAGRLGERNENSVLFSLSALTATENAAAKSGPSDDAIDLGLGGGSKNGKSAVDDLMNIGGGAIGGPMLAPPPLLAPVVEPPPAPAPVAVPAAAPVATMGPASFAQPTPQPKSKAGLIIGIVAAVAVIGGVGAFFAIGGGGGSGATTDTTTPAGSVTSGAASATTSAPAVTSAPTATEAPAASGDASPTSSPVASNDSSKTQGTSAGGSATSTKGGTATTAAPTASAKASAAPTSAPTAAPTATDTGAGGGRDFNKGAATTALSAAAGRAKGCKQADGPTGSASVRVVFAPSGNVTSANVQGPPFAGTPVGGCIAAAFRGASVPPFDGSPVAVTKTVNIN